MRVSNEVERLQHKMGDPWVNKQTYTPTNAVKYVTVQSLLIQPDIQAHKLFKPDERIRELKVYSWENTHVWSISFTNCSDVPNCTLGLV